MELSDHLQWISDSARIVVPEITLTVGIVILLFANIFKVRSFPVYLLISISTLIITTLFVIQLWPTQPLNLFHNMLRADDFSSTYKLLFILGAFISVCMMSFSKKLVHPAEFFSLLLSATLGSNLLAMSTNFVMVILSLELISISSYVLAGYSFSKTSSEGSLKYFLFGSAITAVMIYGISLLFGFTGTLEFASETFVTKLIDVQAPLLLIAGMMVAAGFLFKATAAPFHLWAPDVYEAAPMPVVAFFSVVPKLAGIAALLKFALAMHLFGQSHFEWQMYFALIAILSITIGNVSALWQKNVKRMMAYSSVAQAGFLVASLVPLSITSTHFMIFYSAVFLLMNFLVFTALHHFESSRGTKMLQDFAGVGKEEVFFSLSLLVGLVSLVGLPPVAGFTAKLFVFSSLWEFYQSTGHQAVLWLIILGLVNTVIALFFYLKIPYYAFMKDNGLSNNPSSKFLILPNLLVLFLVIALLLLFFYPALLMGWVNRVNFVL